MFFFLRTGEASPWVLLLERPEFFFGGEEAVV